MPERFSLIPAVYVLLRNDDKIFLIRRAHTGYRDGFYSLPSGHIDGNESAVYAAAREAKEEVGVEIAEQDLKMVHVMHRLAEEGDHERVDFFFVATKWQGEPYNAEPDKCDDAQWFPLNELPETLIPIVKHMLQKIESGEPYSDLNFVSSKS
jgi:8-oxo-dGTP diphosphatase